jgi:hypothetical protein
LAPQAIEDLRALPSWTDAEVVDRAVNAWARAGEGEVRVGTHAGDYRLIVGRFVVAFSLAGNVMRIWRVLCRP